MEYKFSPEFKIENASKIFKTVKIRCVICFILLLTLIWSGIEAVKKYWSQPLTTEIMCENDYKVIFPMITFCPLTWNFFQSFTTDLMNDQNFKMDHFLYSLYTERKHVIDSAHFYTGSKYMELEHLNGQLVHISI